MSHRYLAASVATLVVVSWSHCCVLHATAFAAGASNRRFEAMMDRATFADDVIVRVGDARLATILRGIRAAREDEPARKAFEILYSDVAPVRLAGELVFRRIEKVVRDRLRKDEGVDESAATLVSKFDAADVLAARELFKSIADDEVVMNREDLLRSEMLRSLGECQDCTCRGVDTCASVDRFVRQVENDDGAITFVDFMLGATRALYTREDDDWEDVLSALRPKSDNSVKFDRMCDDFRQWNVKRRAYYGAGDDIGEGGGGAQDLHQRAANSSRLDVILDGCFAGLENKRLLAALRTVFEDYDSLRLCADLIFKLMQSTAQRAPWWQQPA